MADSPSTLTLKSGRTYPFIAERTGATLFKINDTTTPLLDFLALSLPKEFNKALGSLGFWIRNELKGGVDKGGPTGLDWPDLSRVQSYRILDDAKGGKQRAPATHPFSTLNRALAYKLNKDSMSVHIGWLSKSAARYGARLQAGFDTPITEKMRRFFYAADFGLIKTGSIRTPGRPLMLPVFEHVEAQIPQRIEAKIAEYLDKADRQFAAR